MMNISRIVAALGKFLWPKGIIKRCVVILVFCVLAAFIFLWRYFTDPDYVLAKLQAELSRQAFLQLEADSLEYSFPDELQIKNLRLFSEGEEALLRSESCDIDLDFSALISGNGLPLDSLKLDCATITLTQTSGTNKWNFPAQWLTSKHADELKLPEFPQKLPSVEITNSVLVRRELTSGSSGFLSEKKLEVKSNLSYDDFSWSYQLSLDDDLKCTLTRSHKGLVHLESNCSLGRILDIGPERVRQFASIREIDGQIGISAILSADFPTGTIHIENFGGDTVELGTIFNIRDLSGFVDFGVDGLNIRSMSCHLPNLGSSQASVSGSVAGYSRHSGVEIRCELEDLTMPLEVDDSDLGRVIADAQQACSLNGDVDIEILLSRSDTGKVDYQGRAIMEKMGVEVGYFPYHLDSVSGKVDFDSESIRLDNLKAFDGDQEFTVKGMASVSEEDIFDITITGHDLNLDDKFSDAFTNSSLQEIRDEISEYYKQFSLSGVGSAVTRVWCKGKEYPVDTSVDILLDGRASASYSGFPYRLSDLSGTINIHPDGAEIITLTGKSDTATIVIDGEMDWAGDDFILSLDIAGEHMSLDEKLSTSLAALSDEAVDYYNRFNLSGMCDFDCNLEINGDKTGWLCSVSPKNAAMEFDDFPYPLKQVNGSIEITPDNFSIENLSAVSAHNLATTLDVHGVVDLAGEADPQLRFDIENLQFDSGIKDAIEFAYPDLFKVIKTLSPTGLCDAVFTLTGDPEFPWKLESVLRGAKLQWKKFDVPVTDIYGQLDVDDQQIMLKSISAKVAGSSVNLAGSFEINDLDLSGGKFSASISELEVTDKLLGAVPKSMELLKKFLAAKGSIDIDIQQGSMDLTDEKKRWQLSGSARYEDLGILVGLEISELAGSIDFDLNMEDFLSVKSVFRADSAIFGGRRANDLGGTIERFAKDQRVRVDFNGGFCGGKMDCGVNIFTEKDISYDMSLLLEDVDLKAMLNDAANVSGSFDGSLTMRETPSIAGSREGTGDFRLSEGRIAQAPLVLGLTNMIFLQLPIESVYSSGQGNYAMKGKDVWLRSLSLQGRDVSVLGESSRSLEGFGKVDMDTKQLDLVFVVGPPAIVRGPVRQLWKLTSSGVAKFRVFGPWDSPQVRSAAYDNLMNLLAEMGD